MAVTIGVLICLERNFTGAKLLELQHLSNSVAQHFHRQPSSNFGQPGSNVGQRFCWSWPVWLELADLAFELPILAGAAPI